MEAPEGRQPRPPSAAQEVLPERSVPRTHRTRLDVTLVQRGGPRRVNRLTSTSTSTST
jgi:hypothetical protein